MTVVVLQQRHSPIDGGTRFTHVEHGVFFDQFWDDGPSREDGSRGLLDALGTHLKRRGDAPEGSDSHG